MLIGMVPDGASQGLAPGREKDVARMCGPEHVVVGLLKNGMTPGRFRSVVWVGVSPGIAPIPNGLFAGNGFGLVITIGGRPLGWWGPMTVTGGGGVIVGKADGPSSMPVMMTIIVPPAPPTIVITSIIPAPIAGAAGARGARTNGVMPVGSVAPIGELNTYRYR